MLILDDLLDVITVLAQCAQVNLTIHKQILKANQTYQLDCFPTD